MTRKNVYNDADIQDVLRKVLSPAEGADETGAAAIKEAERLPADSREYLADFLQDMFATELPEIHHNAANSFLYAKPAVAKAAAWFILDVRKEEASLPVKLFTRLALGRQHDGLPPLPVMRPGPQRALMEASLLFHELHKQNHAFAEALALSWTPTETREKISLAQKQPQISQIFIAEEMEAVFFAQKREIDAKGTEAARKSLLEYPPKINTCLMKAHELKFIADTKGEATPLFIRLLAEYTAGYTATTNPVQYIDDTLRAYEAVENRRYPGQVTAKQQEQVHSLAAAAFAETQQQKLRHLRPAKPSLKPPAQGR